MIFRPIFDGPLLSVHGILHYSWVHLGLKMYRTECWKLDVKGRNNQELDDKHIEINK